MLHSKVSVNATSRVQEDAPGHSILQHDMPDDEDPNCEDARKKKLSHCPERVSIFVGTQLLIPRASFLVRRARSSRSRIGSPGSVSSLEFRSRLLGPSGRSRESALAAVMSSTSTVIISTHARSTPVAPSQLTKPFSTRWKPSATRPACRPNGATCRP